MNTTNTLSKYTTNTSVLDKYRPVTPPKAMPDYQTVGEQNIAEQNTGGVAGGIGYVAGKLGLGALGILEGIWDFTAGGLAKLFGADDWAEKQFANNLTGDLHQGLDEWYNPSKGWQVAGDVAGGIGNSLVGIGAVAGAGALAVASGGTLSGASAALISTLVMGTGAAGNSTSEAYAKTGELGAKEFGYGAVSGLLEGGMEGVSSLLGAGTGAVVKRVGASFGKDVAKSAARQTVLKSAVNGFLGEAFEEGVQEFLDPYIQRWTKVDPNAENATIQEIAYASLIGGLSGAIMGGADTSIRNIDSTRAGNKIIAENKTDMVLEQARNIAEFETINKTGIEQYKYVSKLLDEYNATAEKLQGKASTIKQKMLLGALQKANTSAVFTNVIAQNASNIINNAEILAERINSYGIKDSNGKVITVTAEQLRNGVNDKGGLASALKTNDILRSLAIADTVGKLSIDSKRYAEATLMGEQLGSQVDLNVFKETASPEQIKAVGEQLGITDWNTLNTSELQSKLTDFIAEGKAEQYRADYASVKGLKEVAPIELNSKLVIKEGANKYTYKGTEFTVLRNKDSYRIYDEVEGLFSKPMSKDELKNTLKGIKSKTDSYVKKINDEVTSKTELDILAKENIEGYNKLTEPNKVMIREVLRNAKAVGISESDALSYARVATHAGINVEFSKELCGIKTSDGSVIYANGFYDVDNNRIVVNPETTEAHKSLLLHELTHAIYKTVDGKIILEKAVEKMSDKEKQSIIKRYTQAGRGSSVELIDELNAHYMSGALIKTNILEKLYAEKPSIKDKIIEFFKNASKTYASDEKLSRETAKLMRRYKKIFDDFSKRNSGMNAVSAEMAVINTNTDKRYSIVEVDGKKIVNIDTDQHIFDGVDKAEYGKVAKEYMKSHYRGKTIQGVDFNVRSENEFTHSKETQSLFIKSNELLYKAKMRTVTELEKIINTAEFVKNESAKHPKSFNKNGYNRYNVEFLLDGKKFKGEMLVALGDEQAIFYDIVKVKEDVLTYRRHNDIRSGRTSFDNSIVENTGNVNQYETKKGKSIDNKRYALAERDFETALDNLDSFKSVEDIKSYFDRVQSMINDEARKFYPQSMADYCDNERQRAERVIKAANIEKEAIKAYRKKHKAKPVVDLSTQAKIEAIDKQYTEAIAKNDLETARYLIEQMALIKGYSVTDYRMDHQAPYNDGYSASLDDVTSMFGEDIYGSQAVQYFGTSEGFDYESVRCIQRARKRPEMTVRIYRAVPTSIKSDQIRNGDWITLTRKYAEEHGKSNIIGNYRVITAVGKAKHIYTDGNSIHEFGYDDGSNYYYRDTKNFKKLADVITFDNEGNPIRLRDRFNYRKDDVRYALSSVEPASPTRKQITTDIKQEYTPTRKEKVSSGWTAMQIAFVNEQAGIEKVGKKLGVKNIEAIVQAARAGRNQAEEMIAGNQYRIGADAKIYQGEGLENIFRPINDKGEEVKADFFDYLFNHHHISRMTLESRSLAEKAERSKALQNDLKKLRNLNAKSKRLQDKINGLGTSKTDNVAKSKLKAEITAIKAEAKVLRKKTIADRKALNEYEPLVNKPVLDCTVEESNAILKKYNEKYPEFKETAEKVWAYLKNLNQYRVDTGLISQDFADYLADIYPYYVPTYRVGNNKGIGAINGKYNLAIKRTVKTAKGSIAPLMPIDVMISRQTMETIRAGRVNQLANALYEQAERTGDFTDIEIVSKTKLSKSELTDIDLADVRPKDNEITFFRNGEKYVMRVSKEVFAGFNAFNPSVEISNPLINLATSINKTFKKLVTAYNPAFLVRNSFRDIQDAGIYTKYGKSFAKNYAKAVTEIKNNGEYWKLYRAMGGLSSSIFDFDKGYTGKQNKHGLTAAEGRLLNKGLTKMENANAYVEQMPRLAEFISSLQAGNTAEQAILDSADVTTNFGRTGAITKKLNATLIPFLNPAIQGCSKLIRTVTSVRTARSLSVLLAKVALVGLLPQLFNQLLYDDDEDYKNLRNADKENNYLFKVGKTFIKIPKGRVSSVLAGIVNRTTETVKGDKDAWDGYLSNVVSQVTPVDNMSRTIFSPFMDIKNNLTWYGSAIEGRQFENVEPKQRYDESTSSIAIALGKFLNYSPKKIHYLLDQYSGVIGDFILPATTKKAEKDFISGNFTLDPASSNKLSEQFYKIYDNSQYAKTAGNETAAYQVKYLNKIKSAISEMYKQKSEVQNSDLSNSEKLMKTRAIQVLINEAYKTAINDFDLFSKAVQATENIDEKYRYTETTRLMYGAERALREYNKDVYEKAVLLNKTGIDYDTLYNWYFSKANSNSRTQTISNIKKLNITTNQKLLLIYASGYALKDNDLFNISATVGKNSLRKYIMSLRNLTQEEKEILLKFII